SGGDSFLFNDGGTLAGNIDGGGGTNSLTGDSTGRTFTLTGANAGTVSTILGGTFSNIQNLTGGTGNDRLLIRTGSLSGTFDGDGGTDSITGNNAGDSFYITGSNSGGVTGLVGSFTSVENLVGGTGDDTFSVEGTGSLSGSVTGDGGTDTLTYASYTGGPVSVTLSGSDANGFSSTAPTALGSFAGIDTLIGSGSTADALTGEDMANTWTLGASQTYNDTNHILTFSAFEILNGGSDSDTFNVTKTTAGVPLTLNGNGGDNLFFVGYDASAGQSDSDGTLADVAGDLTINGGVGGVNLLDVSDETNTHGVSWTILSTDLQREGAGDIAYS